MSDDQINETEDKVQRFINDTDKTKEEYNNINKRAGISDKI